MGVDLRKKSKDLIASEREDRGHGKGVGVYVTLLQSDTVQSYGRVKDESALCTTYDVVCSRKVSRHL